MVAKRLVGVAKKVEPAEPLKKIDLSTCRLEAWKYPQNCGAVVLAEFADGHARGVMDPPRALTAEEWEYILKASFAGNTKGGGMKLDRGRVIHFSELKRQSKKNFSGTKLYEALTKELGCTGNVLRDRYYNFFQVNVSNTALWNKLKRASNLYGYDAVGTITPPDTVEGKIQAKNNYGVW